MPALPGILGFANRWYPLAVQSAQRVVLPSGTSIQLITAPAFLATKFEAFSDRGKSDLLGRHDMEDIVNVLDGRPEIVEEVAASPDELKLFGGSVPRAIGIAELYGCLVWHGVP
jgi:predicted nucleotidyltransferase